MPIKVPTPYYSASRDLIGRLRTAYEAGDVLAVLQASRYARDNQLPVPPWVSEPLEGLLADILQGKKGKPGKGNSPHGKWKKMFVRTVRASAYRYVQAWRADPSRCIDLPAPIIVSWSLGQITSPPTNYSDALRLAHNGLKGTPFQAQSETIRKAANGFPEPVVWRRREVEAEVGLRGENAVFGPPADFKPSPKIEELLEAALEG